MIRVALLAATAGAVLLAAAPAYAQKTGDKDWAACVWAKAPVSAANWLARPLPMDMADITTASEALGQRLVGMCGGAADEYRPNIEPKWKSVASALRSTKPDQPGTADAAGIDVLLCSQSASGDIYRYDVVRSEGGKRTIVFQQYYNRQTGRLVRVTQSQRIKPAQDAKITEQCQKIGSNGKLTDV